MDIGSVNTCAELNKLSDIATHKSIYCLIKLKLH